MFRSLKNVKFFIVCTALTGVCLARSPQSNLPSLIVPCYENATLLEQSSRLPPTLNTLISLINKLERFGHLNMDMRVFSATLLHRFRVDGIERDPEVRQITGIVPYTTSGRQHAKYKVVMGQMLPPGGVLPEEALEDFEKCALHFMLSPTVDPWERGDEHQVCPLSIGGRSRNPNPKHTPSSWSEWPTGIQEEEEETPNRAGVVSRCPIEDGIMWTPWGAVSAAAVLGGIAAGLQPQRVPLHLLTREDEDVGAQPLDNTWAATLAGDLAEVAVYQGPRAYDSTYLRMGPGGRWNDTGLARIFYFDPWTGSQGGWEQESWDLTEAELRGNIDGLALASRMSGWLSQVGSLRLSQLLDMYYSERGVAMENSVRACRRADLEAQLVLPPVLRQQTESFSRVLQNHVNSVPIKPAALKKFSNNAVDAYLRFSETVLYRDTEVAPCAEGTTNIPYVELIAILDGSWTKWEGQRIISILEQFIDVSTFGSAIAVMDGWSGVPIVNFTRRSGFTVRALEDPVSWPTGLNMERSIRGSRQLFLRRRAFDAKRGENVAANSRGTVILVLAPTATNDASTLERAREEMRLLRATLPDVTTLFVTARRKEDYVDFVEDPERDIIVVQGFEGETESLPILAKRLNQVPGRILPAMCPALVRDSLAGLPVIEWVPVEPKGPLHEDYVTPDKQKLYRVPSSLLLGSTRVKFTIRSSNYGDLMVCLSRGQPGVDQPPPVFPKVAETEEERCESLLANSELRLTVDSPCINMNAQSCKPIFLWIVVQRSDLKCTEPDCRYPDQVRFSLWHEGLQPLPGCIPSGSMSQHTSSLFVVSITLVITYLRFL